MLTGLACALLVGQLLVWLSLEVNARRAPDLGREPVPERLLGEDAPAVLAVVPARNEERNIGACVEALGASRYGRLRVRVVDDGSEDETFMIASRIAEHDPRIEVIHAGSLPPGWLGKNHAVSQGTRGATSDYLLFVDADLRVEPGCVARAVAAAERTGADLVSMVPEMEARSFWERAVQPLVTLLICAFTPVREVNEPGRPEAAATGPFMLMRREAYEAIGGHASVRDDVVEDLRLAQALKRAGRRILWTRGPTLARLRMYDSLAGIVRGWSKNFHVALGRAQWAAPLLAAALLFFFAGPLLLPPLALALHRDRAAVLAGLALLSSLASREALHRHYRLSRRAPLFLPLGAAVLAAVVVRAAHRRATGRSIEWKGRDVV